MKAIKILLAFIVLISLTNNAIAGVGPAEATVANQIGANSEKFTYEDPVTNIKYLYFSTSTPCLECEGSPSYNVFEELSDKTVKPSGTVYFKDNKLNFIQNDAFPVQQAIENSITSAAANQEYLNAQVGAGVYSKAGSDYIVASTPGFKTIDGLDASRAKTTTDETIYVANGVRVNPSNIVVSTEKTDAKTLGGLSVTKVKTASDNPLEKTVYVANGQEIAPENALTKEIGVTADTGERVVNTLAGPRIVSSGNVLRAVTSDQKIVSLGGEEIIGSTSNGDAVNKIVSSTIGGTPTVEYKTDAGVTVSQDKIIPLTEEPKMVGFDLNGNSIYGAKSLASGENIGIYYQTDGTIAPKENVVLSSTETEKGKIFGTDQTVFNGKTVTDQQVMYQKIGDRIVLITPDKFNEVVTGAPVSAGQTKDTHLNVLKVPTAGNTDIFYIEENGVKEKLNNFQDLMTGITSVGTSLKGEPAFAGTVMGTTYFFTRGTEGDVIQPPEQIVKPGTVDAKTYTNLNGETITKAKNILNEEIYVGPNGIVEPQSVFVGAPEQIAVTKDTNLPVFLVQTAGTQKEFYVKTASGKNEKLEDLSQIMSNVAPAGTSLSNEQVFSGQIAGDTYYFIKSEGKNIFLQNPTENIIKTGTVETQTYMNAQGETVQKGIGVDGREIYFIQGKGPVRSYDVITKIGEDVGYIDGKQITEVTLGDGTVKYCVEKTAGCDLISVDTLRERTVTDNQGNLLNVVTDANGNYVSAESAMPAGEKITIGAEPRTSVKQLLLQNYPSAYNNPSQFVILVDDKVATIGADGNYYVDGKLISQYSKVDIQTTQAYQPTIIARGTGAREIYDYNLDGTLDAVDIQNAVADSQLALDISGQLNTELSQKRTFTDKEAEDLVTKYLNLLQEQGASTGLRDEVINTIQGKTGNARLTAMIEVLDNRAIRAPQVMSSVTEALSSDLQRIGDNLNTKLGAGDGSILQGLNVQNAPSTYSTDVTSQNLITTLTDKLGSVDLAKAFLQKMGYEISEANGIITVTGKNNQPLPPQDFKNIMYNADSFSSQMQQETIKAAISELSLAKTVTIVKADGEIVEVPYTSQQIKIGTNGEIIIVAEGGEYIARDKSGAIIYVKAPQSIAAGTQYAAVSGGRGEIEMPSAIASAVSLNVKSIILTAGREKEAIASFNKLDEATKKIILDSVAVLPNGNDRIMGMFNAMTVDDQIALFNLLPAGAKQEAIKKTAEVGGTGRVNALIEAAGIDTLTFNVKPTDTISDADKKKFEDLLKSIGYAGSIKDAQAALGVAQTGVIDKATINAAYTKWIGTELKKTTYDEAGEKTIQMNNKGAISSFQETCSGGLAIKAGTCYYTLAQEGKPDIYVTKTAGEIFRIDTSGNLLDEKGEILQFKGKALTVNDLSTVNIKSTEFDEWNALNEKGKNGKLTDQETKRKSELESSINEMKEEVLLIDAAKTKMQSEDPRINTLKTELAKQQSTLDSIVKYTTTFEPIYDPKNPKKIIGYNPVLTQTGMNLDQVKARFDVLEAQRNDKTRPALTDNEEQEYQMLKTRKAELGVTQDDVKAAYVNANTGKLDWVSVGGGKYSIDGFTTDSTGETQVTLKNLQTGETRTISSSEAVALAETSKVNRNFYETAQKFTDYQKSIEGYINTFDKFGSVTSTLNQWFGLEDDVAKWRESMDKAFCENAWGIFGGQKCQISNICSPQIRDKYIDTRKGGTSIAYSIGPGGEIQSTATIQAEISQITHYNETGEIETEYFYQIEAYVLNNKPDGFVRFILYLADDSDNPVKILQKVGLNKTKSVYNHRGAQMINQVSATEYRKVCIDFVEKPKDYKGKDPLCAPFVESEKTLSQPPVAAFTAEATEGAAPVTAVPATSGAYETEISTDW